MTTQNEERRVEAAQQTNQNPSGQPGQQAPGQGGQQGDQKPAEQKPPQK